MKVLHNASLKPYNTFGIDVKAKTLIQIETLEDLKKVLKQNYSGDLFVLGGGSNMLLTKDVDAIVVHIGLKGKEVLKISEEEVYVKIFAGENWHEVVLWTLENNWGGFENLSLIPGNIGTAPIQNIGAYGVEIKDTLVSLEAIDIQTLEVAEFSNEDCKFGYRDSVFKTSLKGKYIITSVTFRLSNKTHKLLTDYGAIQEVFKSLDIEKPSIKDVSNAVIQIRQQKLPDPKILGNSGSFFKNPVIEKIHLEKLIGAYPEIPFYKVSEEEYKIPAGWLIEKAGLKGYRQGDVGVHKNQALVLVNYGEATGGEILNLSKHVQEKVMKLFQIELQPEVNII